MEFPLLKKLPGEAAEAANRKVLPIYRHGYETLVAQLGAIGSTVSVRGTVQGETGQGSVLWTPLAGLTEVIFPTQEITGEQDDSYRIGTIEERGHRYVINRQSVRGQFSPGAVAGHLAIQFDGVSRTPLLAVSDLMPASELPHDAIVALKEVFAD